MITLKLPNGDARQVAPGTRPRDVAESIGKRLAQDAIAAKVNGEVVDLARELPAVPPEVSFQILTPRDPESLEVLRHSTAHVMARAVMRLFPGTQLAFGPALANGFYYDIESPTPITEADFPRIEAEMKKIIAAGEPFERFERPTAEGRALCADLGQELKVEHIDDELKKYPTLSFYRQGEFIDLCRGPHIPHAGKVGAFKLLSIAGAYWKNDASKKQLQRLYATAFFSQKELDAYLVQLEEAKKRDHRLLGKQLKLFTIVDDIGPGMVQWLPKGTIVRHQLESFIRAELLKRGYQPVVSSHIGKTKLYETSGHFPYYRASQFSPFYGEPAAESVVEYVLARALEPDVDETKLMDLFCRWCEDEADKFDTPRPAVERHLPVAENKRIMREWLAARDRYILKPMNCPHHVHMYKAYPKSYRDLPIKLAEFGTVYRYEQSGELNGMTRVRGFTQDDAHLFVSPEQVEAELRSELELAQLVLRTLGLSEYRVRVSVRDPAKGKYVGAPELWERAEATLTEVAKSSGLNYSIGVGEAAFYGPKIDFIVKDCIGREWQLGTVQLDYNLPERFDLEYVGADNQRHRPVMIHRAPFGSMERFCGILIEHFAGAFPLWLAPEQARIVTVSDKFIDYAKSVEKQLKEGGFRVTGDYRPEKMQGKIRDASLEKVPYILIVGEKEQAAGAVALRDESVKDQNARNVGSVPVAELIARFRQEVDEKRIRNVSTATAGLSDAEAKYAE
jgi:threonyl-tRNA synthetase